MPRILPRLIKLPLSGQYPLSFPRAARVSQRKPVPPLPSVLAADYPRSVLLSPGNIITSSHDYVHHKSKPPVHRLRRQRVPQKPSLKGHEPLREMSPQERIWWSSPYLRILASPLRLCFATEPQRYLPAGLSFSNPPVAGFLTYFQDFMVRLAPMRVPALRGKSNEDPTFLFPDGLQHPKFKPRKIGRGTYVLCWREALDRLLSRGRIKRAGSPAPRLAEQIAHLLRLRVLQELQLLAEQLEALYRTRSGPAPARAPVIRRLTRVEWGSLRTTGVIPHPGAIAVLIVPPVNRDPTTKQRPPAADAMSDGPPVDPSQPRPETPKREVPPPCVLHPTHAPRAVTPIAEHEELPAAAYWEQVRRTRAAKDVSVSLRSLIPLPDMSEEPEKKEEDASEPGLGVAPHAEERVPLYNGAALFPGRVQRARLHALLTRILSVEGAWRFSAGARSRETTESKSNGKNQRKGDNKGSHAFLVCGSDEVDVGALGVALWRVRMWEGGGWDSRGEWPWVEQFRPRR
ncbi:hypothetical protein C8R44DRAFT_991583 [Mycena epipterygia]|nr:hypothetical protein C8R44DRAFT_991583 [Mycena epipterygia]